MHYNVPGTVLSARVAGIIKTKYSNGAYPLMKMRDNMQVNK